MIVTKENGTVYTNGLTIGVINWHKEVGYTIVDVNRPLTKNEDGEYVDDVTDKEVEMGSLLVSDYLSKNGNSEKNARLNSIVVTTTNGNVFDGNETARNNMISAIMSADLLNKYEEYWKLADNSTKLISLDELREALALSIEEVGNTVKDY